MNDIKSMIMGIRFHGRILLKGFVKTIYGTATAGLIAMAVMGFLAVPSDGGYVAVCDFIGATATMAVALCGMYAQGGKKRGAK